MWGYSSDGGEFYSMCSSKGEALEECGGDGVIAELEAIDFLPFWYDALQSDLLEEIMVERMSDAPLPDLDIDNGATKEMLSELQDELCAVAERWVERHGIRYANVYQVIAGTEEEHDAD